MPSNPSAESKSLSLRNLTDTILDWDMETPQTPIPPNFSPRVAKYIPDSFKTGEEYCETMEPLLVLECWEQFLQARAQPPKLSYKLQFERLEMVDQSHELIFAADSKETKGNGWTENTILLLSLEKVRIMGRILSMTMKPDKCKIVLEVQLKGLRSKYAASLRPQTAWVAREIYSLTTVVREYNSLINFKQVTLKREILNPEVNPPPFSDMEQLRRESQRLSKLSVNEPQACAITAAVYYKSGFVLINGPPGSGKTRTIIGMIGALKSTGQSRILICAPSNAAIDEIGQRLLSGIQDINGDIFQPKVVRVGSGSTHDSIKKITLDNLLEAAFNSDPVFTSSESLKRSKTGIDGKLKSLHDQRTSLRILASASDSTSLELQQQLQQLSQEIHNLKDQRDKLASSQSNLDFDTAKKQLRQRILGNADIVLATLSASGQDIVSQMGNVKFPLVIIDEACQSVEVSSLIPLRCGARKVILVGDPNQLPPTVMSQVSKSKKYDQSLFARIAQKTPKSVMLLSIQYRMHPELSIFPSKHFYNSRLQDAPGMAEKRRAKWHEKFKPYQCIHVPGEEKTGGMQSYYNMMEVDIIVGLVKRLADAFPLVDFSQKIGIITFYSSQLSKLKSRFQQEFGPRILQSIDINTVDGFQGQEKEIVFLSTVRTKSIGFTGDVRRINVSLTRAMSTLVIVGNVEALRKDPTWYKLIEDAERRKLLISLKPNQLPFISQTTFNNLYSKETPIEDENRKRKRTNE
ncbi:AAA domain-containing protein [Gorgonomyces haynaldii]|nr:AAA domain-containing protein [Gorgonomyces haynaldii]